MTSLYIQRLYVGNGNGIRLEKKYFISGPLSTTFECGSMQSHGIGCADCFKFPQRVSFYKNSR